MRGHAQMIPFGCWTPTVSIISHDKLKWFLEDIGHEKWGVDVQEEQFEQKLLYRCEEMLARPDEIRGQIKQAQEKLWKVTCDNLERIKCEAF